MLETRKEINSSQEGCMQRTRKGRWLRKMRKKMHWYDGRHLCLFFSHMSDGRSSKAFMKIKREMHENPWRMMKGTCLSSFLLRQKFRWRWVVTRHIRLVDHTEMEQTLERKDKTQEISCGSVADCVGH
ncbi:uncharacterized protein ACOB8E_006473 [Sarcophilus harrisii]